MCGIVGQAFQNSLCNPELLRAMRDTMAHRGPDDAGEWYSQDFRVGLGHRRLAIIDLSSAGHQPMLDDTGKLAIVFNGEIYNFQELRKDLGANGFKFRSNSDTEVILAAYREWGKTCVERLNGMFSFCIWDDSQRILFLARDRVGEKPLYFKHDNGGITFASELKAIMANPEIDCKINLDAFNYYLAYGYVPCSMSILRGIEKLPQARAMVYDLEKNTLMVWKYWDLPVAETENEIPKEELCEEFLCLMRDSVKRQMIADVPIGILLSGGIDSTLVTAIATEVSSKPVQTFTISFPGYPQYDEARFANIVAEHFGTDHTQITIHDDIDQIIPLLAKHLDEPLADHAIVPTYLIAKSIRQRATVALSGDGGDELFGGYPHYAMLAKLEMLKKLIPSSLRSLMAACASNFLPIGTPYRHHLIGLGGNLNNTISHINLYFDSFFRQRLLSPEIVHDLDICLPEKLRILHCSAFQSPIRQLMGADFMTTLTDGYLVKTDRATMMASLELRSPFLDYRMIEFAYNRIPEKFKVSGNRLKILLRYINRTILPAGLNINRKQGFTMPISEWSEHRTGKLLRSTLCDLDPNLWSKGFVLSLFSNKASTKRNMSRLFSIAMFELWRRAHRVTF
jgi:asparagine synthase (glutamine-hydrolysing)